MSAGRLEFGMLPSSPNVCVSSFTSAACSRGDRARVGWHVDRVLLEQLERHYVQGAFVCGSEDDEGGDTLRMRAQPRVGRHAPAVARLQPGEVVLRHRRAQVVSDALLILEELRGQDGTDRVAGEITGAGAAASVA